MHESSGVLKAPVSRLINNETLSEQDIGYIRAYLRQWIDSPVWDWNCDTPSPMDAAILAAFEYWTHRKQDPPKPTMEAARALATLRLQVRFLKNRLEIEQWVAVATEWGMDPL